MSDASSRIVTRGSLREIALPDLVAALNRARRTGKLRIVGAESRGEVEFRDGEILDARFGSLEREAAVYAMLAFTDGEYEFDDA